MVAVKLLNIMSGSITFENILSLRVLEWLAIIVIYALNNGLLIKFEYRLYHRIVSPQNSPWQSAIAKGFAEANSVFIVIMSAKILAR